MRGRWKGKRENEGEGEEGKEGEGKKGRAGEDERARERGQGRRRTRGGQVGRPRRKAKENGGGVKAGEYGGECRVGRREE